MDMLVSADVSHDVAINVLYTMVLNRHMDHKSNPEKAMQQLVQQRFLNNSDVLSSLKRLHPTKLLVLSKCLKYLLLIDDNRYPTAFKKDVAKFQREVEQLAWEGSAKLTRVGIT